MLKQMAGECVGEEGGGGIDVNAREGIIHSGK